MPVGSLRIAFAFPPVAGHFNPSLPIARSLVSMGHEVHYFAHESLKKIIESTGATFHSLSDYHVALSDGRYNAASPLAFFDGMLEEYGVKAHGNNTGHKVLALTKVGNLTLEAQLPGTMRFLSELKPSVLVYDPMLLCRDAYFVAQLLGIPTVSLLTVAGPGGYRDHMMAGVSPETWVTELEACSPHVDATARLNAEYKLSLPVVVQPLIMLDKANTHLVTTSEALQDPLTPRLAKAYETQEAAFTFVGPLLDQEGSLRLGISKDESDQSTHVLAAARAARAVGRCVVMVSMGTILTSDGDTGWNARAVGVDGRPRGLSGKQLCQAAWNGSFDALGAAAEHEGPLLILSLGNRTDALDNLTVPPNVLCAMGLPQVDLLKIGIDAFVTHGGQNSFMESMSYGTPVVVCPGFGDQVVNAQKAAALGVGVPVMRPDAEPSQQEAVASQYRDNVKQALLKVLAHSSYREEAKRCAAELQQAGGVHSAIDTILKAAVPRALHTSGGA